MLRRAGRWGIGLLVAALTLSVSGSRAEEPQVAGSEAASAVQSDDPGAHLAYASILFYNGRQLLRDGKVLDGEQVFREVEAELLLARQLSDRQADAESRRLLRSQSAYLLGDLYAYVRNEPVKAKGFYEEAVREFPNHQAAAAALKRLQP